MTNYYEQIIELYNETDRQKRGYAFEQIVREIQPWSHKPPVSAVGKGEQLDGVFEWENNIFLVEAKAKESKILQGSKDWEDFELKIRRRNKSVVGLFLSLYDVDNSIIERCKSMNQEGYRIFVIYGNLWEKLVSEPIGFELIIRYLLIYSRINYIPTVNSIKEVKDWFFRTEDILKNYNDICIKYSSPFLRRFKMDQHESLYVKRETDNKLESYLMNLYPKALSREKKIKTFTSNTNVKIYETDRLTPPQIIIIRDVCGAGKTTFAIENALNETKYISFSKSASEQNIDIELVAFLENLGQDYGLLELYEINRPIIAVIDSLDESQRITNKYPEIKSIISFVSHLNTVSKKYGFYAFPIAIVFTIREEYWRDWEALFEGQNVKHFFKTLSEYNETEFALALKKYQQVYRYNICNKLSKSDISVLSNPLNLYIFSETYKYSGNITISEVFTANVLHNYFKNKSEEVMKRGITYLTPRVFLDICERFLCLCVYNSLNLNRNDFYNCIKHEFKLFDPYTDEIIRLYESESIFRFDEFGILVIRHLKNLE